MILNTKWHGCASIKSSPISVFKPRFRFLSFHLILKRFCLIYSKFCIIYLFHRKKVGALKAVKSELESAKKKARLSAAKKERIKLPDYGNGNGNKKLLIGEFMSHPSAIEALLNTNALKSFQCLAANTYRSALSLKRSHAFPFTLKLWSTCE